MIPTDYTTIQRPSALAGDHDVLTFGKPKDLDDTDNTPELRPANDETFIEEEKPLTMRDDCITASYMQDDRLDTPSVHAAAGTEESDDEPMHLDELTRTIHPSTQRVDTSSEDASIEEYPLGVTNLADLDLTRAVRGKRPDFLTAPYKLIHERVTIHWPFHNCELLEPLIVNFKYDPN